MKLLKHLGIASLFMVAMFFFILIASNIWARIMYHSPASVYVFANCALCAVLFLFGLILSKLHEIHKAILNKGSADPDTLFIDRDQDPKGD